MGHGADMARSLMQQYPHLDQGTANHIAIGIVREGKDIGDYKDLLNMGGSSGPPEARHHTPAAKQEDYAQRQQEAYDQYREQNAQKELDIYKEMAPQYAQEMQDIIEGLYPNQSALGEMIAGDVKARLESDNYVLPDSIKNQYIAAQRGAQSDRGLFRSGMGSEAESTGLAQLGLMQREADLNRGQSLSAGTPKANAPSSIPGMVPEVNDYYTANLQAGYQYAALAQQKELEQQKIDNNSLNSWRQYQLGMEQAGNQQSSSPWGAILGTGLGILGNILLPGIGGMIGSGIGSMFGGGLSPGGATTSYGVNIPTGSYNPY